MVWHNPEPGTPLGKQELAVLIAIATHGSDGDTLAELLHVQPLTIKTHKHNIARKLGVSGQVQATTAACVAVGFRTGLLSKSVLPPFAVPSPEYRRKREADPYVVRHEDGTTETRNTWLRPKTGDKQ